MVTDPLSLLKDIHQPPPIAWWPPAPGWWLILLLFCASLFVAGRYLWPRWQRLRRQKQWRQRLQSYELAAQDPEQCHATLIQLSQILRGLAQQAYPEKAAGQLLGSAWLSFLNETSDSQCFTGKLGKALVVGPYSPTLQLSDKERQNLFLHITSWVLKHV